MGRQLTIGPVLLWESIIMALPTPGRIPSCSNFGFYSLTPPSPPRTQLLQTQLSYVSETPPAWFWVPTGSGVLKVQFLTTQKGCHSPTVWEGVFAQLFLKRQREGLWPLSKYHNPAVMSLSQIQGLSTPLTSHRDRGIKSPRFKSQLCFFLARWPQGNHLLSLSLSFQKMGTQTAPIS